MIPVPSVFIAFLGSQLYTIRPNGSGLKQVTHIPDGTAL